MNAIEVIEQISLQMITQVCDVTAGCMRAMEEAKAGNIPEARELLKKAEKGYGRCHEIHSELISRMASGETIEFHLLLVHAEDQMMNAEVIKIMAEQIVDLSERLAELEKV
jgi:Phosphotransferase system cellobiose-specific component IIA